MVKVTSCLLCSFLLFDIVHCKFKKRTVICEPGGQRLEFEILLEQHICAGTLPGNIRFWFGLHKVVILGANSITKNARRGTKA